MASHCMQCTMQYISDSILGISRQFNFCNERFKVHKPKMFIYCNMIFAQTQCETGAGLSMYFAILLTNACKQYLKCCAVKLLYSFCICEKMQIILATVPHYNVKTRSQIMSCQKQSRKERNCISFQILEKCINLHAFQFLKIGMKF